MVSKTLDAVIDSFRAHHFQFGESRGFMEVLLVEQIKGVKATMS